MSEADLIRMLTDRQQELERLREQNIALDTERTGAWLRCDKLRAEGAKLREENAALRAQFARGDDELRRFFYYPEQATEAETTLAVAAGALRARLEAAARRIEATGWSSVEWCAEHAVDDHLCMLDHKDEMELAEMVPELLRILRGE